ncbi:MAG: hypothetical protein EOM20_21975 [Spartobacteria bacterium]|nr:hypothetical protein [Spartobacteria bacterium]
MKTLALILVLIVCAAIIVTAMSHVRKDAYRQGWLDGYQKYIVENYIPDSTVERVIRPNPNLKGKAL